MDPYYNPTAGDKRFDYPRNPHGLRSEEIFHQEQRNSVASLSIPELKQKKAGKRGLLMNLTTKARRTLGMGSSRDSSSRRSGVVPSGTSTPVSAAPSGPQALPKSYTDLANGHTDSLRMRPSRSETQPNLNRAPQPRNDPRREESRYSENPQDQRVQAQSASIHHHAQHSLIYPTAPMVSDRFSTRYINPFVLPPIITTRPPFRPHPSFHKMKGHNAMQYAEDVISITCNAEPSYFYRQKLDFQSQISPTQPCDFCKRALCDMSYGKVGELDFSEERTENKPVEWIAWECSQGDCGALACRVCVDLFGVQNHLVSYVVVDGEDHGDDNLGEVY